MYICDTHTHSRYSFDGEESVDALCRAACAAGLSALVITDHYDIDCIDLGFYPDLDTAGVRRDIERAKADYAGRLAVFRGVELGQAYLRPAAARKFLDEGQYDFVIGSCHNLAGFPDFSHINFSDMNDTEKLYFYRRMIAEVRGVLDFPEVRTVAHLTYPLRYMQRTSGSIPPLDALREEFTDLFRAIIGKGVAVELNTAGFWKGIIEPKTEKWVLSLYRACGGELVTIGSDAHASKNIGRMFKEGYDLLREVGFKYVVTPDGMKDIE